MYGAETIRTKIGEDLATLTIANGRSFDVGQVDLTGELDPSVLTTPALQLINVEGESSSASASNASLETLHYAIDLFARPGELPGGLERAAADVRNVLERREAAILTVGKIQSIDVSGWEFVEGPDVARSLLHQVRFRIEVEHYYSRGNA